MKKRLISMLMAVLMIASLLPASAVFATDEAACMHMGDVTEVSVKKDRAKKVAGVEAVICNDCGAILKSKKDRTVSADGVTITPFTLLGITCNKCKNPVTVEVQAATCGTAGLTVSYCADCGKKYPVEALASKSGDTAYYKTTVAQKHAYTEFAVEVKPTCLEDGWGYVSCKNCGEPKFVKDAAAASYYVNNSSLSATERMALAEKVSTLFSATNPNHRDHSAFVLVTKETVAKDYYGNVKKDKDNKDMILEPKTAATHVSTINGKVYELNIENGTYTEANDQTMFKAGYTGDKVCPVCGEGFKDGVPDTSTEHKIDASKVGTKNGEVPTFEAAGKYDKKYCSECGWIGGDTIPKLKTYWTAVEAKDATCKAAGSYKLERWIDADDESKINERWVDKYGREVKDTNGTIPVKDHTWVKYTVEATCETDGCIYAEKMICSVCGKINGNESARDITVKAPGHNWEKTELVPATCQHKGLVIYKCSECNAYELDNYNNIKYDSVDKVDKHVASDKLANVKEATCTEEGYTGDVVCKFCGEVMKVGEKTKMVDHTPVAVEAKAPTCTEPGISKGTVCKVCEKVLSGQETVPALGHDPKLVNAKDATCTEAGYTGDKVCTRCNVTLEKGKDIKALGHNFVKGVCSRCDAKQTGYNPFSDVKSTDRFYSDIMWAWENGIVEGDDTGMFRADGKLTRAQVVTMLWRMNDKPTAKNAATFTDLTQDWYKAAVAWAVEKGIVNGVGNNKFAPNETCTRAQIVTMLWRLDGEKKVTPTINFTDLTQNWYKDAVAWAANNGITKGDGAGHFYPANDCTRGEAVAFIHRTAMLGK